MLQPLHEKAKVIIVKHTDLLQSSQMNVLTRTSLLLKLEVCTQAVDEGGAAASE